MSGWYAVKRGITSHHLFKGKPERLAVWMWLMDNAAWKDTTHDVQGCTVSVPRGSVCASSRHIADMVGVGHQVARTALKRFESELMINTKVTHGKSVVSLCNFERYQDPNSVANTAPNTPLTQDQHKPNTQKKQGNKVTSKQEKEDTNVSLSVSPPAIDEIAKSVSAYNATAARVGWPIVQKLSPARRTALTARLKDAGGADGWDVALAKAEASPFLTGQTSKPFSASFDFLTKQSNFTKLMEGNYDPRNSNEPSPSGRTGHGIGSGTADAFAAVALDMQRRQSAGR